MFECGNFLREKSTMVLMWILTQLHSLGGNFVSYYSGNNILKATITNNVILVHVIRTA